MRRIRMNMERDFLELIWRAGWQLALIIICGIALGLCQGCSTVRTLINPAGPKNAALIASLQTQVTDLKGQVAAKDTLLGSVAGNVYGVHQGAEHIEAGKGKDIVVAEADLAASKTGPASPAEQAAADARIIATLKGDLAEQKRLYGVAIAEGTQLKQTIDAHTSAITARDSEIAQLKTAQAAEQADAKVNLDRTLKANADALQAANDAHAKNLQAWASRLLIGLGIATVIGCGALIFLTGISALAKAVPGALGGLLLIGAGIIVGQSWFLYVVGGALVLLLIGGILVGRHLYLTGQIETKLRAATQDLKDEAAAGVPVAKQAFDTLKEHLAYRIPRLAGDVKSSVEKEIDSRLVKEGINTAAP
jgi:hypothetical protein